MRCDSDTTIARAAATAAGASTAQVAEVKVAEFSEVAEVVEVEVLEALVVVPAHAAKALAVAVEAALMRRSRWKRRWRLWRWRLWRWQARRRPCALAASIRDA